MDDFLVNNGSLLLNTVPGSPAQILSVSRTDTAAEVPLAQISMFGGGTGSLQGVLSFRTMNSGVATGPLVERMRVHTNGNVGIGTATPMNRLDVEGGAAIGASYSGTSTAPANGLLVQGRVGLGTAAPKNKLDVEGSAVIGAAYSGTNAAPANGLLVEGNVGVGTTTPTQKLEVAGTVKAAAFQGDGSGLTGVSAGFWKSGTAGTVYYSGGKVGIGTATPSQKLHVSTEGGDGGAIMADGAVFASGGKVLLGSTGLPETGVFSMVESTYSQFALRVNTTDQGMKTSLFVNSVGNIGIGTTNPSKRLHVVGDVTVQGALYADSYVNLPFPSSDLRLKKNIKPVENALAGLAQLRGVRFEWKDPEQTGSKDGEQLGLIAQEVESIFPQLVALGRGHKTLNYYGLIPVVIEAIKELQAMLSQLKRETVVLNGDAGVIADTL